VAGGGDDGDIICCRVVTKPNLAGSGRHVHVVALLPTMTRTVGATRNLKTVSSWRSSPRPPPGAVLRLPNQQVEGSIPSWRASRSRGKTAGSRLRPARPGTKSATNLRNAAVNSVRL
jgi:hypothetical protein